MKNYRKVFLKVENEQLAYVGKIKNVIFDLLESKGSKQRNAGTIPATSVIIPDHPKFGYEFLCETNGTGFSFNVRVMDNYIEVHGTIPGAAPVKSVTKKWYSLNKLEHEFIQIFGACFYKSGSVVEMLEGKLRVSI